MAHDNKDDEIPDWSKVIEKVNEHVDTRMQYLRLLITEKVAIMFSKMGSMFILIGLFVLFFLFISISGALWIGKYYENYALGFLMVSGFYFLIAIVYLLFRHSFFEKKMQDTVVNSLYPENEEEDEDE